MTRQAPCAELIGTAGLLTVMVGSGRMGEQLADGNVARTLRADAPATGFGLYVVISVFAPVSGAHFNPAVSLVEAVGGRLPAAVVGVRLTHLMFDLPMLRFKTCARAGSGQFASELVATFGLVLTMTGCSRHASAQTGMVVRAFFAGAYGVAASRSLANAAVTTTRGPTNTFPGIRPIDAAPFVAAPVTGAALTLIAAALVRFARQRRSA
jgi:glycerol uptake facilitator-like aquaporin